MTIGTIVIIILGVAYVVWSYYAIMDLIDNDETNIFTKVWAFITFINSIVLIFTLGAYLANNWNTKLF
jgi:cytochrome bd-type quinol oxidase subunit 2